MRTDSLEVEILFNSNEYSIDASFADNRPAIDILSAAIQESLPDGRLHSIDVMGYSSPDGVLDKNERLALTRAESMVLWMMMNLNVPDEKIGKISGDIAWDVLISELEGSSVPYRNKVIRTIQNIPVWIYDQNGRIIGGRKHSLMNMHGGDTWSDMIPRFFHKLRKVVITVVTETKDYSDGETSIPEEPAQTEDSMSDIIVPETAAPTAPETSAKTAKPTGMALKTNLFEDIILIPNIGLEFHLGKGWSLGMDWRHAWWNDDRVNWYWRIYGGELSVNKYFGKKAERLAGHHLGLFGQVFIYDFAWGGKGIIGGASGASIFDKANYSASLEYGYSFRLSEHLNLDLSIGAGFSGGEFQEYKAADGAYVLQATKYRCYWGPTKAELSLVWLIDWGKTEE